MDLNHVEAAINYPNLFPRFAGQGFAERSDKELALACLRIYNDWMIDEWCAGEARGRLIPLTVVPLWDPQLAADEVRRCAQKGSFAACWSRADRVDFALLGMARAWRFSEVDDRTAVGNACGLHRSAGAGRSLWSLTDAFGPPTGGKVPPRPVGP